jgi:hypothetical protein
MTTQENSQPQQEQQLDTETSLDEATLDGVVGGAAPLRSALTNKAVLAGLKDYDPIPPPAVAPKKPAPSVAEGHHFA